MAYDFRYSLAQAPQARQDGSGCVDHDIWAQYREDDGEWLIVPGRHKTVSVPAAELAAALGSGTTNQKVTAYKTALATNLNMQPEPITGWTSAQLLALTEANAAGVIAATTADDFITVTLGLSYPVAFNI